MIPNKNQTKLKSGGPITINEENDCFGYINKIKSIRETIELLNDSGFLDKDKMIALYGNRGSGKSSVMKTLCEGESGLKLNDEFECLFFEARKFERDEDLSLSLLYFVIYEIQKRYGTEGNNNISNNFINACKNLIPALISATSVSNGKDGISGNFNGKEFWDKLIKEKTNEYLTKTCAFLDTEKIKKGLDDILCSFGDKKKIIIFIDDLDRCESENVIKLLSVIKLFFTLSNNMVFVVGVDKDAITKGLSVKYNDKVKAEEYLEKIFTLSFSMPKQNSENKFQLDKILSIYYTDEQIKTELSYMMMTIGFTNPRHLQKLLNKIKILENIINEKLFSGKLEGTNIIQLCEYILLVYIAMIYEFYFEDIYTKSFMVTLVTKNSSYNQDTQETIDKSIGYMAIDHNLYSIYKYALPQAKSNFPINSRINGIKKIADKLSGVGEIHNINYSFIKYIIDSKDDNYNNISEERIKEIMNFVENYF